MKTENRKNKPIIWTISGADCSGGAGIAADIKTGHGLGVGVCHLITANTVQNSTGLISVNSVDIDILQQQALALLVDNKPTVIKIGVLANHIQVQWLTVTLKNLKKNIQGLQVVYDPVGQASVGGNFSGLSVQDLQPLLCLVDVITPNLMEAQILAGGADKENAVLAQSIQSLDINSVIIKGGHSDDNTGADTCIDYCLHRLAAHEHHFIEKNKTVVYQLSSPRIHTRYTHGGGCTFATALASFLAYGYLLRDAFTLAKAFINQGLKLTEGQQDKYGVFEQGTWPKFAQYFPFVTDQSNQYYQSLSAFKSLNLPRGGSKKLGLYPVVDSIEWLKRLLPLGINIIQLRLKNNTEQEVRTEIKAAVELSKQFDCQLFINDFWQLAIEYGAYGVHIGQGDLLDADLNAIQQAGLRLGISTHGCYEFLLAQQLRPSYLAIGAIFPTKTKDMIGQIQGVENLKQTLQLATDIPVVAIGGINHERAATVWQTGVDSIAVVTAITEAISPEQAVEKFKVLMN
jgi:hydroxymethylpyrimidine kinase/phosphomethylpyrimidine kinase/thiamine-phosphate diphosphorylase